MNRTTLTFVLLGLVLVCVTLLAALGILPGEKVLDLMTISASAFIGAAVSKGRNGNGNSLRPPAPAEHPREPGR